MRSADPPDWLPFLPISAWLAACSFESFKRLRPELYFTWAFLQGLTLSRDIMQLFCFEWNRFVQKEKNRVPFFSSALKPSNDTMAGYSSDSQQLGKKNNGRFASSLLPQRKIQASSISLETGSSICLKMMTALESSSFFSRIGEMSPVEWISTETYFKCTLQNFAI